MESFPKLLPYQQKILDLMISGKGQVRLFWGRSRWGGMSHINAIHRLHAMKKTHVIQDLPTGKFFTEIHPGSHKPEAEDERHADFYTKEEADAITAAHYMPGDLFAIREGGASAYMAFLGRRGGRTMSPAKVKANKRRSRRKRPGRQPSAAT